MYWHGLGTTLAMVFLPLLVLALGLMFRGARDARTVGLLGLRARLGRRQRTRRRRSSSRWPSRPRSCSTPFAPRSPDAARSDSSDGGGGAARSRRSLPGSRPPPSSARESASTCCVRRRSSATPVDYRFFNPDWLSLNTLDEYLSAEFLLLAGVSLLVLLLWRRSAGARDGRSSRSRPSSWGASRRASSGGSRSRSSIGGPSIPSDWRSSFSSVRPPRGSRRWAIVVPVCIVLCAYFAHTSIGLRLPQRLLAEHVGTSSAPAALDSVRARIDGGELPDTRLGRHRPVPPLRRSVPPEAADDRGVRGVAGRVRERLPAARRAAMILDGGPEGRRLATELGPATSSSIPGAGQTRPAGLSGTVVVRNDDVLVVRLPPR